jgi:hypothetical protein
MSWTIDEPTIYCQRCKGHGGIPFRGWQILCQGCIDSELNEWFEDE